MPAPVPFGWNTLKHSRSLPSQIRLDSSLLFPKVQKGAWAAASTSQLFMMEWINKETKQSNRALWRIVSTPSVMGDNSFSERSIYEGMMMSPHPQKSQPTMLQKTTKWESRKIVSWGLHFFREMCIHLCQMPHIAAGVNHTVDNSQRKALQFRPQQYLQQGWHFRANLITLSFLEIHDPVT